MENYLEKLIDKTVVIIFSEESTEKTVKGQLRGFDETFVFLETYQNTLALAKKDIIKIKTCGESNG